MHYYSCEYQHELAIHNQHKNKIQNNNLQILFVLVIVRTTLFIIHATMMSVSHQILTCDQTSGNGSTALLLFYGFQSGTTYNPSDYHCLLVIICFNMTIKSEA